MTTIISRLYDDARTAKAAAADLAAAGFPDDIVHVITRADGPAAMRAARLGAASADAYADGVAAGKALLVVEAPFSPIGAARQAMQIADKYPSAYVAGAVPNDYIAERPRSELITLSILSDHPRFLSQDIVPGLTRTRGRISDAFGLRTLSRYKTRRPLLTGTHISTKFLPFKLIYRSKRKTSAFPNGGHVTGGLMALISRRR